MPQAVGLSFAESCGGGALHAYPPGATKAAPRGMLACVAVISCPSSAWAQELQRVFSSWRNSQAGLARPNNIHSALVAYDATMRDWNSSQPLQ